MNKTTSYLYFGYKPFSRQLDLSCLVICEDFLVADIMIPTLTTHIDVLTIVLGTSLNLLEDIIVFRLCGIGSLGLFLLLASFILLLSSARPGISMP
jgi:hypothetical protein